MKCVMILISPSASTIFGDKLLDLLTILVGQVQLNGIEEMKSDYIVRQIDTLYNSDLTTILYPKDQLSPINGVSNVKQMLYV
jgi:hypothetical protein